MKRNLFCFVLITFLVGCAPVYQIPTRTSKLKGIPTIKISLGRLEKIEIKGNNISVKNDNATAKGISLKITTSSIQLDGKALNKIQLPFEVIADNDILELNGKKFRGSLIIYNKQSNFLVVNKVDMESYLKGVVPCELKTTEVEALKAQIIASRSFALHLIKPGAEYYDLTSGVEAQVYKGIEAEVDFIDKVIEETHGIVCTYNGETIQTQYSSNCGGRTANGKAPYLKSTPCQFCKSYPNYRWECSFSRASFFEKLGVQGNSFSVTKRDKSGRILEIQIPDASCIIKGEQVRAKLGLRSTFLEIKDNGDKIIINGKGYGHGIGLCQYGAVGMSKQGFDYKSILKHYYSGIKIEKIY
ncbi:MAG: SpoIID/LytB domain-containing protein [bacterium]|nr:SpoIID/LytB domain-containing protein [bacterium]